MFMMFMCKVWLSATRQYSAVEIKNWIISTIQSLYVVYERPSNTLPTWVYESKCFQIQWKLFQVYFTSIIVLLEGRQSIVPAMKICYMFYNTLFITALWLHFMTFLALWLLSFQHSFARIPLLITINWLHIMWNHFNSANQK